MRPVKAEDARIPELAKFCGHGASVNAEIVRQLLSVKGYGERCFPLSCGFGGQVGEKLFTCGSAACDGHSLGDPYIFLCGFPKEIFDEKTSGRNDAPGIYKDD